MLESLLISPNEVDRTEPYNLITSESKLLTADFSESAGSNTKYTFVTRNVSYRITDQSGTLIHTYTPTTPQMSEVSQLVSIPSGTQSLVIYTKPIPGTNLDPIFTGVSFRISANDVTVGRVYRIRDWDKAQVRSIGFDGMSELIAIPADLPVQMTSLRYLMFNCSKFNDPSINNWRTHYVTNMERIFSICPSFNQPLSNWDTSNVTTLAGAFSGSTSFAGDLTKWNVDKVTDMNLLFNRTKIDSDISEWNTGNVVNMRGIFAGCQLFNQDLSGWDVSKVTNFEIFDSGATIWNPAYKPKFSS